MGIMQGAQRFGGILVSSPTFHRFVHSTNRLFGGALKRASEKPDVWEQTERLKEALQNQSAFVKDKAGECMYSCFCKEEFGSVR